MSVGIASNKMLAKLASQAIKPDGILVIDGDPAMQNLLKTTAVSRLPRCGGKVTDTLTLAGINTVTDLQVSIHPPFALSTCPLCTVPLTAMPAWVLAAASSCVCLQKLVAAFQNQCCACDNNRDCCRSAALSALTQHGSQINASSVGGHTIS